MIGYLTGFWSQTHFVIDAIRCIDYLLTRSDVDTNAGISITGVSGGGVTSFFTALLDERIKFVAPVCCLNDHETLHLTGLYTSCPEQFGCGYIANGIDYVDYISAIAPRPCLIVGGKDDEVFDYNSTISIFKEARAIYESAGYAENIGICLDMLSHYGALTEKFPFSWRQSIIIPNILKYYDLPDMVAEFDNIEVFIINPMDAQKNIISQELADKLYERAISKGTVVRCNVDGGNAVNFAIYK